MSTVSTAFEHTRVPYGDDGKLVRGIIARCSCGAAIPLPVNTMNGFKTSDAEVEFQFIAKILEQKGWRVGRRREAHLCPKCAAAKIKRVSQEKPMVSVNKPVEPSLQVVQENARVMQREDRRIIFEKLNEVYVSDKVGYGTGWTDEKVATDLGVPRAWVQLIRKENFGDEVGNEEIRKQLEDGKKMLAEIRQAEDWLRKIMHFGERLEKQLAEIQKVLK